MSVSLTCVTQVRGDPAHHKDTAILHCTMQPFCNDQAHCSYLAIEKTILAPTWIYRNINSAEFRPFRQDFSAVRVQWSIQILF